jgi:pimeloyl-ACP methyl ester carboxylesterase
MPENTISLTAQDGVKLCAIVQMPENAKALVILCHGFGGDKNSSFHQAIIPLLEQNQIAHLRFDFRGCGDSEGLDVDLRPQNTILDLLGALTSPIVDEAKSRKMPVIICGTSFGGYTTLLAQIDPAFSQRVDSVILRCPVSDYPQVYRNKLGEEGLKQWRGKGYIAETYDGRIVRTLYSFFDEIGLYDVYKRAEKLMKPCLVLHGKADDLVPFSQSEKLALSLPQGKLISYEGCDHRFSDPQHKLQAAKDAVQFILSRIVALA